MLAAARQELCCLPAQLPACLRAGGLEDMPYILQGIWIGGYRPDRKAKTTFDSSFSWYRFNLN